MILHWSVLSFILKTEKWRNKKLRNPVLCLKYKDNIINHSMQNSNINPNLCGEIIFFHVSCMNFITHTGVACTAWISK